MLVTGWIVLYGCTGTVSRSDEGKVENVIVITADGLRWQEGYKGMDSLIAANSRLTRGETMQGYSKITGPGMKRRGEKSGGSKRN